MSSESNPSVLTSLPPRPLSVLEAAALKHSTSSQASMEPISFMADDNGKACVVIRFVSEISENLYILGYSPKKDGWEQIESWSYQEWENNKQTEAIQDWAESAFENKEFEHSTLNF